MLPLQKQSKEWQDWLHTLQHFFKHNEICKMFHNKNDNRNYIKFKVMDRDCTGLLDSGANLSVISTNFATILTSLGLRSYVLPGARLSTADGTNHTITEAFDVPVSFDDQFHIMAMLVMPGLSQNLLLGKDFFDVFGIQVKLKSDCALINKGSSLLETTKTSIVPIEDLSIRQQQELGILISDMRNSIGAGLGRTDILKHNIDTENHKPAYQKQYNFSPTIRKQIEKEIDDMLEYDVIEPSISPWCSPVLLVKKPNGDNRLCLDSRQLNKITKRDTYPLPRVTTIIDNLRSAKFLSTLDLKSAFWQIPLEETSKEKTTFAVPGRGLFQFKVMPFGLVNASQTQQRLMDILFQAHNDKVWAYLDDIIICTSTFDEHLEVLRKVMAILQEANLSINVEKCKFARSSLKFLGYIVDREGLRTDPEKVTAILNFPRPNNFTELKRFIGLASWYRRFVQNFSLIAAPLHNLTKGNKKTKFVWSKTAEDAFLNLKTLLTSAPVVSCPDYNKPFIIQCDASNEGIGAVLVQKTEDTDQPVAYLSRKLNDCEKRYSASEKELLSVVYAVEKFRPYVDGVHFTVITDHKALLWLHKMKDPHGRLARWAMKLQQFSFDIIHRPGKLNVVPDALSRSVDINILESNFIKVLEKHKDDWYLNKVNQFNDNPNKNTKWAVFKGLLFRKVNLKQYPSDSCNWKLFIPDKLKEEVLKKSHDDINSGHLGVRKTFYRIKKDFFWFNMLKDVKNYVNNCETCAKYKVSQQHPFGLMGQHRDVSRPWQVISLDLMGPFPRSKTGNTMLLVMSCWFSKFVLLFPLRTGKADKICEIVESQILLFGAPMAIICDNGKQFESQLFKEVATKYQTKLWYTPLYHPQSNPTERVNRVVGTQIAANSSVKKHNEWDVHLQGIAHSINTAVHETTGYTPSYLFLGREVSISPLDISALDSDPIDLSKDLKCNFDNVAKDCKTRQNLYKEVQMKLKKSHNNSSKYYNKNYRPATFVEGEYAWKKTKYLSKASNKFMAKLAPKFEKVKIVQKLSNNVYRLQNMQGKNLGIWHANDLKR